jgi:hypothetical protein
MSPTARFRLYLGIAAVVSAPFFLQATTGCSFTPGSFGPSNSWTCGCTCSVSDRDRSLRVAFGADDAEQLADGSISLTGQDLDLANGRWAALRFRDVRIPQGATIVNAFVQFAAAPGSNTTALGVQILGGLAADAPAFTTAANSISSLPKTGTPVSWNPVPSPWTTGDKGANQLTPNLAGILQEIVSQTQWVEGNALALTFQGISGTGLRKAYAYDNRTDLAAVLSVHYIEPVANAVGPQRLQVCAPPEFNPNIGGEEPTALQVQDFCNGKVAVTLGNLSQACGYPSSCDCHVLPNSFKNPASCDAECVENPVNADCGDFDPEDALVQATNARRCFNGANFGAICAEDTDCTADPVCVGAATCTCFSQGDPICVSNLPSFAISAAVYGRRTTGEVTTGSATITVGDEDPVSSGASGRVYFVGDPCPADTCSAGLEYNLDVASFEVGNLFSSATFSNLGGLGGNVEGGKATISSTGDGTFAQNALTAAAQGRRDDDPLRRVSSANGSEVDVNVGWGTSAPTFSVNGTLAGSVNPEAGKCDEGPDAGKFCDSDADCTQDDACSDEVCDCVPLGDSAMALSLDLEGDIINQPPIAEAGDPQEIECEKSAVTNVVLDGSGSSDLDGNLTLFSWRRGTRVGPEVGFDQVSKIEQSIGGDTYVLRVIDAFGEADEDTTEVDVLDTTPPVVTCSVATPVVNQTNHIMVNVGLAGTAEDSCEGTLPVTVDVYGDENDEESTGDGIYSPDAKNVGVGTLRLRAERKGNANGRVYLIVTSATDSSDNRGFSCCTVTVPSSTAKSAQASAQTQAAAARAFCLANDGAAPSGYVVIGDGPLIGPKQ